MYRDCMMFVSFCCVIFTDSTMRFIAIKPIIWEDMFNFFQVSKVQIQVQESDVNHQKAYKEWINKSASNLMAIHLLVVGYLIGWWTNSLHGKLVVSSFFPCILKGLFRVPGKGKEIQRLPWKNTWNTTCFTFYYTPRKAILKTPKAWTRNHTLLGTNISHFWVHDFPTFWWNMLMPWEPTTFICRSYNPYFKDSRAQNFIFHQRSRVFSPSSPPKKPRWWFKMFFFKFHLDPWVDDPISQAHVFQMGWNQ